MGDDLWIGAYLQQLAMGQWAPVCGPEPLPIAPEPSPSGHAATYELQTLRFLPRVSGSFSGQGFADGRPAFALSIVTDCASANLSLINFLQRTKPPNGLVCPLAALQTLSPDVS